jgi:hypothetical protein
MEDVIYNQFENMCYDSSLNELKHVIEKYNIDLNYDNNNFIEIICLRNDIELLKLFINHGCKINEDILSLVSSKGYLELVKYLVMDIGIKYNKLIRTTAYCNYPEIKHFYDELMKNNDRIKDCKII